MMDSTSMFDAHYQTSNLYTVIGYLMTKKRNRYYEIPS